MNPLHSQKPIELDPWEQEILDDLERGEFVSVPDSEKANTEYRELFASFFKKRKNINIRISENDLLKVKAKALEEGIPYQTYLSSLIHKHIRV
jgi:predicted DNA binding CopG/RHH family protein